MEFWIPVEDSEKAILRIFWQNDDDGQLEACAATNNVKIKT